MQQTSQLYKNIVAGENHWFETKVVIDGQAFGEDQILSLHRERLGMSQSKPTVGGALSSTMTLTLLSKAAKGNIVDVSINTLPYKTTYADGELVTAAKLEGLSVKVLYTSGEYDIVPYDNDIVHTNPDVPYAIHFGDSTTRNIDVGYTETTSTGQQYTWFTEFYVTKVDATVEYIELDVPVELLKFYVGETFNVNGLVVTAHYTNNTTADVTSECVYDPAIGTVLTEIGSLNVTVSYTYRGKTVTGGFRTKVFETDDTLLYLTLTSNLTQPLYFTQSAANGVTIDWGDGSAAETVADLSASASHTYAAAGDYTVTMTAGDGVTWSPGAVISNTNYSLLGNASNKNNTYPTLTAFKFGTGCNLRQYSFANCTSLSEIIIPDGTVEIPDNAFRQCTGLKRLYLPTSIKRAHIDSFYQSTYLEEVHIKDLAAYCGFDWVAETGYGLLSFPAIGSLNLYLNGVKITDGDLVVPHGVTRIGNQTFANATFNSVTLPNSVMSIGHGAFSAGNKSTTIQTFIFGTNPISFGANAFWNRNITAVHFPSLEMWLKSSYVPGGLGGSTPTYWSETAVYINDILLSGNVEVPSSITTLHALALESRKEITAVWLRDTVDTIEVVTITSENSTNTYRPFTGCLSTLAIYCEDTADQSGWDSGWNGSLTVTYGQTTRPW